MTDRSFSVLGGLGPSTVIPQKQEELKSTPLTPMTFQYWQGLSAYCLLVFLQRTTDRKKKKAKIRPLLHLSSTP